MSEAHGTEAWVGFGVETTYGTAVARSKFSELLSESLNFDPGVRVAKPALRGVSQNRRVRGKAKVDGGIEFQMQSDGLEVLLKHALGAVNTTGPVSSRYTHAFTLAKALPVGLTVEVNRDAAAIGGDSGDIFAGCQISKLTFKQSAEDFLQLSVELLGQSGAFDTPSTPSFPSFFGFDWEGFTFSIDDGGGYDVTDIMDLELSLDNGLAADRYKLGQLTRKGLGRGGRRKITGKITKEFDSLAERNLYRDQTQGCKVKAVWTAAGDDTRTLTLEILNLEWTGTDPKADTESILSLPMEFEAYIASSEGDEFTATLVNATTSVP